MSRIGKKIVPVPDGVTATVDGQQVVVKGPKGELSAVLVDEVIAKLEDGEITVNPRDETKRAQAMWGLSRTVVSNLIEGVSSGFTKTLEINGVGYRAAMQGSALQLNVGLSHEVKYPIPRGHQSRMPAADGDHHHRYRQAEGRAGRRGNPRLQASGAL